MPKRNRLLAAALAAAFLAAPVFADGKPGETAPRGPEPLKPHAAKPAHTDCGDWSCKMPPVTGRTYHDPAPVPRVPAAAPLTRQPQGLSLDLAAFDGGVGAGVGPGYYGGGGVIVVGRDRRFSGVTDAPGAVFTFQPPSFRRPPPGLRPPPGFPPPGMRPPPSKPPSKPPFNPPPPPSHGCGGCG